MLRVIVVHREARLHRLGEHARLVQRLRVVHLVLVHIRADLRARGGVPHVPSACPCAFKTNMYI